MMTTLAARQVVIRHLAGRRMGQVPNATLRFPIYRWSVVGYLEPDVLLYGTVMLRTLLVNPY